MLFYKAKYVKATCAFKKPTWNLLLQWNIWKLMHVNEKKSHLWSFKIEKLNT